MAARGHGDAIVVDDLGFVEVARGYVCDAHATDAEGVVFTARATAPVRLERAFGVAGEALRRAARAVARERAEARWRIGAFERGAVYDYVVTDPRTAPPRWRDLLD